MTVRQFNFIVGPEQSEIPGASNPVTDSGTATLTNKTVDGDDNSVVDLGFVYEVAFSAETTKNVDVTGDVNAQKSLILVLDADDSYKNMDIVCTRPDVNTITLTSSLSLTKNVRVVVFGARQ